MMDGQLPERNVTLDPQFLGHEVYNLHVMLPEILSEPAVRLLLLMLWPTVGRSFQCTRPSTAVTTWGSAP